MPKKSRKKGIHLTLVDYVVISFLVMLLIVPDPLDFLTFGLPLLEALFLVVYFVTRIAMLRKGK